MSAYGPSETKPLYLCRGGEVRHGRVYSLRIEGDTTLHHPSQFNDLGVYNPGNLAKDCRAVAQYVATALGVEVEVIKHLAGGDRTDRTYWPARY